MTHINRALAAAASAAIVAAGLVSAAGAPSHAASPGTIYVPDDFIPATTTPGVYGSDTRPGGTYKLEGSALHITTANSSAKVAEYVATDTALSEALDTALDYSSNSGGRPGAQLVVDIDDDGHADGILVGESVYGDDWWASRPLNTAIGDAPAPGAKLGYAHMGTLQEWAASFPDARVDAFGFSLGSGVVGDGVLKSITFAGTTYTFAAHVVLTSKEQCKNGGWATSTKPVYKNQGACVSSFASGK